MKTRVRTSRDPVTESSESSASRMAPTVIAFGVAQIIGWGVSFHLPGVIGTSIAESFRSSLDVVLLGPTLMLTTLALVSWFSASLFERHGSRKLMMSGAVVMALALVIMALAPLLPIFLAAWILLGIGGAVSLSTAAQIAMAEVFGDRARQAIGAMSLVSALSNTVLWPVFSRIDSAWGWRTVVSVGAATMIMIYIPIVAWFGARTSRTSSMAGEDANSRSEDHLDRARFVLVAGFTALNGFITWGFSLTLIPLLTQKGIGFNQAVTLASALGVVSIAARSVDLWGNWSPLRSAVVSSATMLGAFLLLYLRGSFWIAALFIGMYGFAAGMLAIVRATLPLSIFPPAAYARASARLALPLNLSFAAAPPIFARVIEGPGANTALVISICLSALAFVCLGALIRLVSR